jgi:hypothetical protein
MPKYALRTSATVWKTIAPDSHENVGRIIGTITDSDRDSSMGVTYRH